MIFMDLLRKFASQSHNRLLSDILGREAGKFPVQIDPNEETHRLWGSIDITAL